MGEESSGGQALTSDGERLGHFVGLDGREPRESDKPRVPMAEAMRLGSLAGAAPEIACPRCGDAGFVRIPLSVEGVSEAARSRAAISNSYRPCLCRQRPLEERLAHADLAGPQTWESWRISNVMLPAQAAMKALIRGDRWCAFIRADAGCGKTHLARATGREWIERGGSARFFVVPQLLERMRATFGEDFGALQEFLDAHVLSAELLILDDLGTERATPFSREQIFAIVDHFYARRFSGSKLIVTSNVPPGDERIEKRVADRLSGGEVEIRGAPSRRKEFDR